MRSALSNSGPGFLCRISEGLIILDQEGFEDEQLWCIQTGLTEGKRTKITMYRRHGRGPLTRNVPFANPDVKRITPAMQI